MIDVHHHLLHGLDDGAADLETSVRMVEMAAQDGITHIVCTPHANHRYDFKPELIAERLAELRHQVNGAVELGTGCDFHLSYDNIEDAFEHRTRYTVNGTKYLLVEFADLMIPATIGETFYEMMVAGMQPILTHPERNPVLQRHPERLVDWLRAGCLIQVTASSLTGRFGRTAQAMAHKLIDQNFVHVIATDAHNLTSRPPVMSEARGLLANRWGQETAERLCETNPRAIYCGQELPEQPEPAGIFQGAEPSRHRSLLGRLFSRA